MQKKAHFFVILGLLAALPIMVFAADDLEILQKQIDARKGKISEIQQQIETVKKALASKQQEKLSLQNQVGIINGRLQKTKLFIAETREQLLTTESTLSQITIRLKAQEQLLQQQRARISELLRALDESERQTVITIVAQGDTLSDFFSAGEQLYDTQTQLGDTTAATRSLAVQLAREQEAYKKTQDELQRVRDQLTTRHDTLKNQGYEKAQLLLRTQESEEKFQKLVADLKRDYRTTENEIQTIEQRVRRAKGKGGGSSLPSRPVAMQWPVPSHVVTAQYHDPDYPFRHVFEHPGTDMRAPQGTPVRAAAAGIVARAKDAGMGYSYVIIVHSNKISSVYGHLSRIVAQEDDSVAAGEIIGYSGGMPGTRGAGPFVTGPHLHFEVRSEGIPVNAMDFID